MEERSIAPFHLPRGCLHVSHLSFADDVIIFSTGAKRNIQRLMNFLSIYEQISGQKINKEKSAFLTGNASSPERNALIHQMTGFSQKSFPFTYLGCPIFKGQRKIIATH